MVFWDFFGFTSHFGQIYYVGRYRIGFFVQTICLQFPITFLQSFHHQSHGLTGFFVGWMFYLFRVSCSSLVSRRYCRFRSFVCMVAPWKKTIGNDEWLGLVAQAGAIQMRFETHGKTVRHVKATMFFACSTIYTKVVAFVARHLFSAM